MKKKLAKAEKASRPHAATSEQVKIVRLSERASEPGGLPPPSTQRWIAPRKARVVEAVRTGLLSFQDACDRYGLSTEEFRSWAHMFDRHGLGGLRATRIQEYRVNESEERRATS